MTTKRIHEGYALRVFGHIIDGYDTKAEAVEGRYLLWHKIKAGEIDWYWTAEDFDGWADFIASTDITREDI